MLSRRRLTLQLTPLLDLLLIVMFSQYIENRNRTEQAEERAAEVDALKVQLKADADAQLAKLEREFQDRATAVDQLRAAYDERFQAIIEQHHQAGSLLAETLNLPGAAMTEILKLRTAGRSDDAERLTSAVSELRQLMQARGEDVFNALVRIDEMQKHVSVWEVHLGANGQATLTDGERQQAIDFSGSEDFVSRLYESSKAFAEPRVLVVVLLSWGDTQAGPRRTAVDSMPTLMDQLRRDAAGTRWYDFSIVGFRAAGPVVKPAIVP